MKIPILGAMLFLVVSSGPVGADNVICGTGVLLEIRVRDDQIRARFEQRPQTAAVYTLAVRLGDAEYTAESSNGRIALFGPFVAKAPLDVCIRGKALVLTRPRDTEPEIIKYEMTIVKVIRSDTTSDTRQPPRGAMTAR